MEHTQGNQERQNQLLEQISRRLDNIEQKDAQFSSYRAAEQNNLFNQINSSTVQNDEIDLKELWQAIWQGKLLIFIITTIFAIASVIYAVKQPDVYRASVLLAPAGQAGGTSGLGKFAGQFGGLASLAGINVSGDGADKVALALEVLKSRAFIENFIEKHQILVPLMAAKKWDRENDKLILNQELYDENSKAWLIKANSLQTAKPSGWQAFQALLKILSVNQDKGTGMVTIEIEHYSPYIAKTWLVELIKDLNSTIRDSDKKDAQGSIDYLTNQLNQTKVADLQKVFYQLIEEQTKTIMLAEVSDEYVFKTIDPANVPDSKAKPKRALICMLGAVFGFIFAILLVLVRYFSSKTD